MGTTKAEGFTALAKVAHIYARAKAWMRDGGTNLADLLEDLQDEINVYSVAGLALAIDQGYALGNQMLVPFVRGLADPIISDLARLYGSKAAGIDAQLVELRRLMSTASETVRYRNITRGTSPAAFATGTTVKVYRCTTSYDGKASERTNIQATRATCVADKNSGTQPGQETVELAGRNNGEAFFDNMRPGTRLLPTRRTQLLTVHRDSLLQNPAFTNGTGEGATTSAITGWSVISGTIGTNIQRMAAAAAADSDTGCHRVIPGTTTGRGLVLTAGTCEIGQKFSVAGVRLANLRRPVFCGIWVRPSTGTAFDGTVRLRLGANTVTLASGAMAAGWQFLPIAFNEDSFYEDFKEDDVRVYIALSAYVAGSLQVSGVILKEMDDSHLYNGDYYAIPASATDLLLNDTADFVDSSADEGEIQTMIAALYGRDLNHASSSETYADFGGTNLEAIYVGSTAMSAIGSFDESVTMKRPGTLRGVMYRCTTATTDADAEGVLTPTVGGSAVTGTLTTTDTAGSTNKLAATGETGYAAITGADAVYIKDEAIRVQGTETTAYSDGAVDVYIVVEPKG